MVTSPTWATVLAARLNVRANPGTTASILSKVGRNEAYPVIGKNSDGSWCQITVNGMTGWVSTRFVTIGGSSNIPVTASAPTPMPWIDTGFDVTALTNVNVRNLPGTRGSTIVDVMSRGTTAHIIGRNANNSWWQVNYQGVTGWVSSFYTQLQSNAELARIPVTT